GCIALFGDGWAVEAVIGPELIAVVDRRRVETAKLGEVDRPLALLACAARLLLPAQTQLGLRAGHQHPPAHDLERHPGPRALVEVAVHSLEGAQHLRLALRAKHTEGDRHADLVRLAEQ